MSQNTKKPYDLPDWPAEAEQTQEAPRPRRKRHTPAEPEDLWASSASGPERRSAGLAAAAAGLSGRLRPIGSRSPTESLCNSY